MIKGQFNRIILYKTLQYMIDNKINIRNKNGNIGYLICKNNYYLFQPYYQYENISLLERGKSIVEHKKYLNIDENIQANKLYSRKTIRNK